MFLREEVCTFCNHFKVRKIEMIKKKAGFVLPMKYFTQMAPHAQLLKRAITEVQFGRLIFHAVNNIRTNLFQPSNHYTDSEFLAPNAIYIEPTMVCNRRCEGCYPSNLGVKSKIDERIAQQVFDTAAKFKSHYVAWIGGEPLLPLAQEITVGVSEKNPHVA